MTSRRTEVAWLTLFAVAVTCLATITVLVVRRELVGTKVTMAAGSDEEIVGPPVKVDDWDAVIQAGHRIGPSSAPVTIVAFSDFECPACARFATQTFPELSRRFPGKVSLLYRNWPLRGHSAAYSLARAAECAADQGHFEPFYNTVFAHRDSIRIKTPVQFARAAGVPDLPAFQRCSAVTGPSATIEADIAEARRIGGRGTPTLVVNGLRLRPPFDTESISRQIQQALEKTSN